MQDTPSHNSKVKISPDTILSRPKYQAVDVIYRSLEYLEYLDVSVIDKNLVRESISTSDIHQFDIQYLMKFLRRTHAGLFENSTFCFDSTLPSGIVVSAYVEEDVPKYFRVFSKNQNYITWEFE